MTYESGTLAPDTVRGMFDRIAPVYDVMNRVMTAGLDRRWRKLAVTEVVWPGDRVLDACCGTGDLAVEAERRGGRVVGLDFSPRMLERARKKSGAIEWVQGDALALPFADGEFDAATVGFGVRNLADLEGGCASSRGCCGPAASSPCSRSRARAGSCARSSGSGSTCSCPSWAGCFPAGRRTRTSPRACAASPAPTTSRAVRAGRLRARALSAARRRHRRAARGHEAVTALEVVRAAAGLDEYLADVESELGRAVELYPGVVAEVGASALAAGGKRLRPALAFLSSSPDDAPPVAAGVAVELVHMATLVHDDLIDGAAVRRGRASAWSEHGEDAAKAAGDYLFARGFSVLAETGDAAAVAVLADASLALARGEAMQRRQRHDPDTTIDDYLERCALKTGKLFEAACVLGGGSGEYGRLLGIAFQIADDVLDCAGDTIETGKVPGTDLQDGTPTLPLLLAAQEDPVVREALAGGPKEGVLVRVAASGALDRSRELALHYASEARSCLDGAPRRDELEALTRAVVERRS